MKPDSQGRVLLTLGAKVLRFRARVALAVGLLVLAKVAAVAVPLVLKTIVDVLSRPEALAALPVALLAGYALVRFSTTLFGELRDLIFARAAQSTVADYTEQVFRQLHALGARFHANRATGALTRDVERGTAAVGFLLRVALFTIVPTLVEIGIVLAIMVSSYAAGFAVIIAVTFVVYSVFTVIFTRRRAIRQRRVNELDSNAHRRLVDSVLNYDTVKFYTNEAFEARRFRTIMADWIEAAIGNQKALTLLHVGQSGIIAAGVAAVMLLAGRGVLDGHMTVGDLVLVNAYVIQVCLPLNSLGFVFREASDALVSAERLFALLRAKPEADPDARLPPLAVANAEVRFENVSFGYEPSRQILWDIDFRIGPGRTVAVVGGSGSGKSTLARLLLRFYEPWSGRIAIDGQDIRALAPDSVRAAIGVVPQDTSLFNETIAYNIGYGRVDATPDEVIAAAKAANLHEFISSLPEGYDTVVGERGLKLSGGEKQRIAIARAILKNPPILVLDEATSALDMRSERAIQAALERIARRRTTLIIAHRLSTVVNADEILVLEAGRIVERGTHQELLALDDLYAQMWSLQEQERALRRSERRAAMRPINPSLIITGAVDAARADIEAKAVNLYTTLGLDVGLVTGDPGVLQEVVWELLIQAIEASEPGARVAVSVERAGNEVLLRVADATPVPRGAPPPAVEPGGGRRHDARAIASIMEEHQGRFGVEQGESGTTYSIALPVRAVAVPPPSPVPLPEPPRPPAVTLAGKRLLIVDDDEDARETLGMLLKLHDAEIESFGSGRQALDWLRERSRDAWPDLMICDIGLPDEDGYSLLRRVRAHEAEHRLPLSRRMPAIALTGYSQAEDRVRALVAGFQAHLAKPVLPEELFRAIRRLLGAERPSAQRSKA
ncbi:MAG TPA: ATP-binding cassette domain-containing protein [Gammaproteobacteria bacterium]